MSSAPLAPVEQDVWWVYLVGRHETKERLSVVMRVETDYVEIVYGQEKSNPKESEIAVAAGHPDFAGMGLTKPTHFRLANVVHVISGSLFRRHAGSCGNDLFLEFEELVEEARLARRITVQPPHLAKHSSHDPNAPAEKTAETE